LLQEILVSTIIPTIKNKIKEYESLADEGKWKFGEVDLSYGGIDYDFEKYNLEQLRSIHNKVSSISLS
jgi:hypothetical protein